MKNYQEKWMKLKGQIQSMIHDAQQKVRADRAAQLVVIVRKLGT